MPKSSYLSSFANNLSSKSYKNYTRKVKLCIASNGAAIDPYALLDEDFDSSQLPKVHILDINDYLVCATNFLTKMQLKDYKSLESYTYFTNGCVSQPRVKVLTDEAMIVLTKVTETKTLRGKKVQNVSNPWLCVKSTGEVVVAHCDCSNDISDACSHIAAVLFYLESSAAALLPEQETIPSNVELRPLAETNIVANRTKKLSYKDIVAESESPPVVEKPRLNPVGPTRACILDKAISRLAENGSKATILSVMRPHYEKFLNKQDSDVLEPETTILS